MNKRARRAVGAIALLLAVSVASYVLGTHTQSARQADAKAGPVSPTALTEPVRALPLQSTLVFRVNYAAGPVRQVSTTPTPQAGTDPVVTSVELAPGSELQNGQTLITVAGEPIIAMRGRLPSYRDLQIGDVGPDVTQLQRDLSSLGYRPNDAAGVYGSRTANAVATLWRAAGHDAPVSQSSGSAGDDGKKSAVVTKGSIVYFPELPIRVASVETGVGRLLPTGTNWLSVRSGSSSFIGQIPLDSNIGSQLGAKVELTNDATGESATARVASTGPVTDANDGSGQEVSARLTIVGKNPFTVGDNLRGVIVLKSTRGPVLSVPLVAVHTAADGTSYLVEMSGKKLLNVSVITGFSANGYVEIVLSKPQLSVGQPIEVS